MEVYSSTAMNSSSPASTRHTSRFFQDGCGCQEQPPPRCIHPRGRSGSNAAIRNERFTCSGHKNEDVGTLAKKKARRVSQPSEFAPVTVMPISISVLEVGQSSSANGFGSQRRSDRTASWSKGTISRPRSSDTPQRSGCDDNYSPDKRRKATSAMSPFFNPIQPKCSRLDKLQPEPVSCLRFPAKSAKVFGLIQERFSNDPFRLLVAVIFLHQTKGAVAIPVLLSFMQVFSTPETLAASSADNIAPFLRPLGLQNRRAELLVSLARTWLTHPPEKGKRYRFLHYPHQGSGTDVRKDEEPLEDEDARVAWEIAHLPGIGPYALDSWRIFCRDALRDLPTKSDQSNTARDEEDTRHLDEEWTRVMPLDKELRAYLQWRWIRLGWLWDPASGVKLKVEEDLLQSMEALRISSYRGFVNPWVSSNCMKVPEEQILGGFAQ